MGTMERKARLREEVRFKILDAAWTIARKEGWHALSMRRIAEAIDYTAPIIYGYFENKEAILKEFSRQGFELLTREVRAARDRFTEPALQLEAMWLAYWDFAFEHQAYYQLMFGVEVDCCGAVEADETAPSLINERIQALIALSGDPGADPCRKFYTFWAVVHGLISLNIVRKGTLSADWNRSILRDAIVAIIADTQA